MNLRQARLAMIRAFPGGWDAMAAALGMTRDALENRIYERRGQSVLTETDLQMQSFSNTTCFAEAVAAMSDGVFTRLPETQHVDRASLLAKFNELYSELGVLSGKFKRYVEDDEIDRRERDDLCVTRDDIHKTLHELMALAFALYCKQPPASPGESLRSKNDCLKDAP